MLALLRRGMHQFFPAPRLAKAPPDMRTIMSVEGQLSADEARLLFDLAKATPAGSVIVEIGTYRGRSAVALAAGSLAGPRSRVYAIDPHLEFEGVYGGKFGPEDQAALYHNLTRAGVGHMVAVLCLGSVAVATAWAEQNVGLLWVDGDHSAEGVRADYRAWKDHVRPGGIIAFHDADAPGVASLLAEIRNDPGMTSLGCRGQIAWFRKEC